MNDRKPPAPDGDDGGLGELARGLPSIDVDTTTAEQIARRVRPAVGKGPSPARLVLPIASALLVTAYLVWLVLRLVEILR